MTIYTNKPFDYDLFKKGYQLIEEKTINDDNTKTIKEIKSKIEQIDSYSPFNSNNKVVFYKEKLDNDSDERYLLLNINGKNEFFNESYRIEGYDNFKQAKQWFDIRSEGLIYDLVSKQIQSGDLNEYVYLFNKVAKEDYFKNDDIDEINERLTELEEEFLNVNQEDLLELSKLTSDNELLLALSYSGISSVEKNVAMNKYTDSYILENMCINDNISDEIKLVILDNLPQEKLLELAKSKIINLEDYVRTPNDALLERKNNIKEDDLDMSKLNDQMDSIGSTNEVEHTSTNKNHNKR